MSTMTREEALQRFKLAREKKKATVERVVKSLKERYEKETGMKANYVFVM